MEICGHYHSRYNSKVDTSLKGTSGQRCCVREEKKKIASDRLNAFVVEKRGRNGTQKSVDSRRKIKNKIYKMKATALCKFRLKRVIQTSGYQND